MNDYCYLDFSLKLKEDPDEDISPVFIKGAIIKSLQDIFGEIGGYTELDLLKFDEYRKRGILRVPIDFSIKLRVALTLISNFQGISAIFQVHKTTNQLPSLIETFIEF